MVTQIDKERKSKKKLEKEMIDSFEKLHAFSDKKLIKDLSKIIIDNELPLKNLRAIHNMCDVGWTLERYLSAPPIKKYFISNGMNPDFFTTNPNHYFDDLFPFSHTHNKTQFNNYFENYGLDEELRWIKILNKSYDLVEKYYKNEKRKEQERLIELFFNKAKEEKLHDISGSILKRIAFELKEEIPSTQMGFFQNIISVKLKKHFGEMPKKQRNPLTKSNRIDVLQRDNYKCKLCGISSKQTPLQVDHILPVDRGGGDEMKNLITLCVPCNQSKSNRFYSDISKMLKMI